MSVQAGIWNFDGRPVDEKLLAEISESLKHQGPDGEFCYVDNSVALLYRPFHTTAESRREKQPYVSHRGFILTWDGRLDNRDELIRELRSDLEANPTDVAIIGAAFERWESDCFRRIVGDWAVSIWNPHQQELCFAIDYMAIRHIFYYLKNDQVLWSTDLSPLVLLTRDKFHIEDDYIAGYFAYDPDAHLTPYREIREVPPGHSVRIRSAAVSVEQYSCISSESHIRYKTDRDYEAHFLHLLRQAVRRRLRSDSPVLAELSGGLDSSAVVCLADEILANEGAQTRRVDTVSFYDKTEPNGDDWMYFPKIEEKRGRRGIHIDAISKVSLPASFEYPYFSAFPGNLGNGRHAEKQFTDVVRIGGYRVVLSGIGGDEFMGGIPNPSPQLADLITRFRLIALSQQLIAWSLAKQKPCIQLLWQILVNLLPSWAAQHIVQTAKVEPWVNKHFAERTHLRTLLLGPAQDCGPSMLPSRRSYFAGMLLMANRMAKFEPRLSVDETAYPYLDQDLLSFTSSIPATQLLRPGERRSLMRRALTGIVPDEVLSRRTKQLGARTPIVALQQNLSSLRSKFQSMLSFRLGYVDQNQFLRALEESATGKVVHITRLFRTISLEFWLRDLFARELVHSASGMTRTGVGAIENCSLYG